MLTELLAQATIKELVGTAGGTVVVTLAAMKLLSLVAKRGMLLRVGNGKAEGNGNEGREPRYVEMSLCEMRHKKEAELQTERHNTVVAGIAEVKASVTRLHERIDNKRPRR
jgi:hypothetical protein